MICCLGLMAFGNCSVRGINKRLRISDHAVNSVSVPGQYLNICQMLTGIVATGTIVCVNQAIGMRNYKKVNELATIAAVANMLMGLLFGALFYFFTPAMLSIMKLETDTLEGAARYMRLTGSLLIFQRVSMQICILRLALVWMFAKMDTESAVNGWTASLARMRISQERYE